VARITQLAEVGGAFLKLGTTSFGGPVAHLGYIRAECVERRRWLDDDAYADLVALCQFLPGPTSSQVVYAIGLQRAGIGGALAASLAFLMPSALAMIGFAYGVARVADLRAAGWLHGLKLAAVAVVAQAVWAMGVKLCPDRPRRTLALLAAAILLVVPSALVQVAVLAAGAVAGIGLGRRGPRTDPEALPGRVRGHLGAALALAVFALLLLVRHVLPPARPVLVFDAFYRAGALVFGGGHVVLPLLREALVPRGWLGDDAFLAGYGAAQAVPGPLFSFAGYLGTVIHGGPDGWKGGVLCLVAIFLPSWLLIAGALPFWSVLRTRAWMQAALRGANAAVVGVLLAALYTPVITEGIHGPRDVAAALVAFGLLEVLRAPPWSVVLLCAAAGQWAP